MHHARGLFVPQDPILHTENRDKKKFEPCHEKTNILVSDIVRHKPGCTATEAGKRLETSDLESIGIVLSM